LKHRHLISNEEGQPQDLHQGMAAQVISILNPQGTTKTKVETSTLITQLSKQIPSTNKYTASKPWSANMPKLLKAIRNALRNNTLQNIIPSRETRYSDTQACGKKVFLGYRLHQLKQLCRP